MPSTLKVASITALLALFTAAGASAQPQKSLFVHTLKGVVLDPTTYAPTLIAYDAAMRDWRTSQLFFQHGYREYNQRFTRSGLPNDVPISFEEGRQLIRGDAWPHFRASLMFNVTTRVLEHYMIRKHPTQRRMVRTVGWIERIGFAYLLSHRLAAPHYRQAYTNEQLALERGYK